MSSIQIAETFIKYGVFITNPSLLPFSVERDSGLEEWWKEGTNFSPPLLSILLVTMLTV